MRIHFRRTSSDDDDDNLSYISFKWPVRSIERLPPYTRTKLKTPVLVIGNMARAIHPRTTRSPLALPPRQCFPRLTRSHRSRPRKRPSTCSAATTLSCSNSSATVTRASVGSRLALGASYTITSPTPRLVFFPMGYTPVAHTLADPVLSGFFYSFRREAVHSAQSTIPICSLC